MIDLLKGETHNLIMFINHFQFILGSNAIVDLNKVLGFNQISNKFNLVAKFEFLQEVKNYRNSK